MKKNLIFFLIISFMLNTVVQVWPGETALEAWTDSYDKLLNAHVTKGEKKSITLNLVDYYSIGKNSSLEQLYNKLAEIKISTISGENAKLAFWINAYNFLTIYRIAGTPDIKSIKDLNTLFKNVWQQKSIVIEGRELTLDDIEHQIIRKKFAEPRIHFALVCAALSCPDLLNRAYRPEILDRQLAEQEKAFLSNRTKGLKIDQGKKIIYLSKIFSWYGKDFAPRPITWLLENGYITPSQESDYKVKYIFYDWDLNSR